MIDLFTVKQNNKYDFMGKDKPDADGTWLCSTTSNLYQRGFSYQISNEIATRIETEQDLKILASIQPIYDIVKKYLGYETRNNCFKFIKQYCGCDNELPLAVDYYIAKMIAYDVFNRSASSHLKSESIGNYSYTKEDYKIGSLYYPAEIVSGLDVFKKVRFL